MKKEGEIPSFFLCLVVKLLLRVARSIQAEFV